MLVALATIALVLDGMDGQVARRTHTVTAMGARFDVEVDTFLLLVLSVHVAPALGLYESCGFEVASAYGFYDLAA